MPNIGAHFLPENFKVDEKRIEIGKKISVKKT
jgi:hypothetical protein